MKLLRNLSLGLALGALTVAGGLPGAAPEANAQGAPPGFFQIPGTSTALLITGSVGTTGILDFSYTGQPNEVGAIPVNSDALIPFLIPVKGEVGGTVPKSGPSFHFSNTNASVGFITNTPTAYGPLGTVLIIGTGNNGINSIDQFSSGFPTANIVVGFGTLGPFMAGLNASLFGDDDANAEHIEPFGWVAGNVGKLNPGVRYTWTGPNGFSIAGAIEMNETDGMTPFPSGNWDNHYVPCGATGNGGFGGCQGWGVAPVWSTGSLGGPVQIPDFILKARLDQPWGHIALAALLHNNDSNCLYYCGAVPTAASGNLITPTATPAMPNVNAMGFGFNLTGHFNTWGKDSLKWGFTFGHGIGYYEGDFVNQGLIFKATPTSANAACGGAGVATPVASGCSYDGYYLGTSYAIRVGYTHFWTDALRSSATIGYAAVTNNNPVGYSGIYQNLFFDKNHFSVEANLIWSPVPKVDLGVEYVYFRRQAFNDADGAFGSDYGADNRISVESVFHF